jgi:hypothetical protein
LLLEASRVVIAGGIFANGGGGGGGSATVSGVRTLGGVGEKGLRSTQPALGGAGALPGTGGDGGKGGTGTMPNVGVSVSFNGGGGGGSAGKIVIRGAHRNLTMATLSPAANQLPAQTQ